MFKIILLFYMINKKSEKECHVSDTVAMFLLNKQQNWFGVIKSFVHSISLTNVH